MRITALSSGKQISLVIAQHTFKCHHANFVTFVRTSDQQLCRYGAIIANRNIKNAVLRNYTKRIIRNALRSFDCGVQCDVVIIAKRAAKQANKVQLRAAIQSTMRRVQKKHTASNLCLNP